MVIGENNQPEDFTGKNYIEKFTYLLSIDKISSEDLYELLNVKMNLLPSVLLEKIELCQRKRYFTDEELEKIDKMRRKYIAYRSKLSHSRKKDDKNIKMTEQLEDSKSIINAFINSNEENSENFCEIYGIDKKNFENALFVLQKIDLENYTLYVEHLSKKKKTNRNMILEKGMEIVKKIQTGISSANNETRTYDMIDYHQDLGVDFHSLMSVLTSRLKPEELKAIKLFINRNQKETTYCPQQIEKIILQGKVEINCQKDKNGFSIPGTGRIVQEEEKISILDHLNKINVPITDKTYSAAFIRYRNNQLFEEEKSNLKMMKK